GAGSRRGPCGPRGSTCSGDIVACPASLRKSILLVRWFCSGQTAEADSGCFPSATGVLPPRAVEKKWSAPLAALPAFPMLTTLGFRHFGGSKATYEIPADSEEE